MSQIVSLLDRFRAAPQRRPVAAPAAILPLPLPAPDRITTARPFDPEWDDPRKAANHAPEKR